MHPNFTTRPPAQDRPLVWISAAETSADLHGAELIRAMKRLSPDVRFRGMGGPHMRQEDFIADFRAEDLSVMGLTEVIEFLPRILRILRKTRTRLAELRPDAVVVIDSPDFHFRIARAAHALGIPVIYYIAPQAWAWRKGRVKFLRRYVDRLLSILPFEKQWFERHGVSTSFVGHPFVDHIDLASLEAVSPEPGRIALLPGSRMKEVTPLLPRFADAARILARRRDDLRFVLIRAPHIEERKILELWPSGLPLDIVDSSQRYRELRSCQMAIAASGTATLECALLRVPTLVTYIVSPISYVIGRLLIKVPYIAMPNLILNEPVFPEFIQGRVTGRNLAAQAETWLSEPDTLSDIRRRLSTLPERLGQGGASRNAAEIVLSRLTHLQPDNRGT